MMNKMKIKKCELSNVESIRHLQPEGWNDITYYFRFYCTHPFCHPVVGIIDNQIVGVAAGIVNGRTAWLAHIIVANEYRKQGIGYSLTEHVMNCMYQLGCKTLLLIATELGEPVYRKLGFETVTHYIFLQGEQMKAESPPEHIRALVPADINPIFILDRMITGEDRRNMLQHFTANGWVYAAETKNITGFFLPEFSEGAIIASEEKAGLQLLKLKHSLKSCKTVLPKDNQAGITFLQDYGFSVFLTAPRMICGEQISWKPQGIFSRAGGYYG